MYKCVKGMLHIQIQAFLVVRLHEWVVYLVWVHKLVPPNCCGICSHVSRTNTTPQPNSSCTPAVLFGLHPPPPNPLPSSLPSSLPLPPLHLWGRASLWGLLLLSSLIACCRSSCYGREDYSYNWPSRDLPFPLSRPSFRFLRSERYEYGE